MSFDLAYGPGFDTVPSNGFPCDPPPDLEAVKTWLGPASTSVTEDELQLMLDSALIWQRDHLRLPDDAATCYPPPLAQAVYRRVARAVATKGLPLGVIVGEYEYEGPVTIRRWDAQTSALEDGYYIHVVA